jgi:hypothetical protein
LMMKMGLNTSTPFSWRWALMLALAIIWIGEIIGVIALLLTLAFLITFLKLIVESIADRLMCDHGLDMPAEPQEMRDRNAQMSEPLLEMPRGVPSATQQQTTHSMYTQPNPVMQYQPQMTTNPAEAPLAAS